MGKKWLIWSQIPKFSTLEDNHIFYIFFIRIKGWIHFGDLVLPYSDNFKGAKGGRVLLQYCQASIW
jgi:hypothetical protein